MKQKYQIVKDDEKKTLILREYAELDKGILSPLCEQTYEIKAIEKAIRAGNKEVQEVLKTNNMYPPGIYVQKIANAVIDLFKSKDQQSVELLLNDIELLVPEEAEEELAAALNTETDDIDELLEDDHIGEDAIEDKASIKNLKAPLKVADDEVGDIDDGA